MHFQEVDHFKFLQSVLGTQGFEGIFFPKPDSPCLYISENNGPDGCAVFFKKNKFELVDYHTRILEVWRVQSNQVGSSYFFFSIEICFTKFLWFRLPLLPISKPSKVVVNFLFVPPI